MHKATGVESRDLVPLRRAHRAADSVSAFVAAVATGIIVLSAITAILSTREIARDGGFVGVASFGAFLLLLTCALYPIWTRVDGFVHSGSRWIPIVGIGTQMVLAFVAFRPMMVRLFNGTSGFWTSVGIIVTLGAGAQCATLIVGTLHLKAQERADLRRLRRLARRSAVPLAHRLAAAIEEAPRRAAAFSGFALQGLAGVSFIALVGSLSFIMLLLAQGVTGGLRNDLANVEIAFVIKVFLFNAMLFAAAVMISRLAMIAKERARLMSRRAFARVVEEDPRPHILFLRSFRDDQVTLPSTPPLLRFWFAEPFPQRFDHALVERFNAVGPVVAVGRPQEQSLPFGAARKYVRDEDWTRVVADLADRAKAIVIVADDTDGVHAEVTMALQDHLVERTVFLASPQSGAPLEVHRQLGPLIQSATSSPAHSVLAAFRKGGRWHTMTTKNATADDYVVACQAFFNQLTQSS